MLKRILIASRSVGAIRVAKTYRKLGLETVGVYTQADQNSLHLKYVDNACPIRNYLDVREIVLKAKACRCDAVDPVYGFRAEHPEFPATCEDYKIIFIGPCRNSLEMMADKLSTAKLVEKTDVQTIPRGKETPVNADEGAKIADEVGFPVILKPVKGGGGKGTLIAKSKNEIMKLFPESMRIAESTTGSPEVYIEKLLENVRHEEIQFLSDAHKNVVSLGGRSCSLQRRKQKIIEETQPEEMIKALETAREKSAEVIKRVGCSGTVTFEFLVDEKQNVYFLEANKRLQVEHRPTEMATRIDGKRIDLVEERLRIAEGEKLGFGQNDVSQEGHAIECRIYSENPWSDFIGCTQTIEHYEEPKLPNTIVDSCLYPGYQIPFEYDPLVATITTHGTNRLEAVANMTSALNNVTLDSTTNLPLLKMILRDNDFKRTRVNTTFVEQKMEYFKRIAKWEELSRRTHSGKIDG